MNKKRSVLLFASLLLLAPVFLTAQQFHRYTVVRSGYKPVRITVLQLGPHRYISPADAARILPGGQWRHHWIWSDRLQFHLRFAPLSLILYLEKGENRYEYQMPYPVVQWEDKPFLPLFGYLEALRSLGVLRYEHRGKKLRLQFQEALAELLPFVVKPRRTTQPVVVTGAVPPLEEGVEAVRQRLSWIAETGLPQYLGESRKWQLEVAGQRKLPRYKARPLFLPPLFYQIPPGLRRPLPKLPPRKTQSFQLGVPLRSSPLLASLMPLEWLAPPERSRPPLLIQKVRLVPSGDTYELYLYANRSIGAYQKPEFFGNTVIIRIPDALHRAGSLAVLGKQHRCRIKVEKIRNILRYTFQFPTEIADVDYRRIANSTALKFRIYFKQQVESVAEKLQKEQQKWKLDVIVLDPGHGGKDAGAIGVTGVREKDITLAIALEVGRLLKKEFPQIKVVYTRTTDRFVELYRRGQIANQSGGKLFVSIHCNSKPRKPDPARGCETYILRPGRNADALEVARRENAVIRLEADQQRYVKLTEEQLIIATMAQRAFVKFSELFASLLQKHVSQVTGLPDRGVHQAGFLVLVGASMPNVLFEAGFLSNPRDEKFLASKQGQRKIARGIVNAIKEYMQQYERMLAVER